MLTASGPILSRSFITFALNIALADDVERDPHHVVVQVGRSPSLTSASQRASRSSTQSTIFWYSVAMPLAVEDRLHHPAVARNQISWSELVSKPSPSTSRSGLSGPELAEGGGRW